MRFLITQVSHRNFAVNRDQFGVYFILLEGNAFLREAISFLYTDVLVVAQYLGLAGQRLYQLLMRWLNPKYWATQYAGVDIASRKNVFPGVQAKNSL